MTGSNCLHLLARDRGIADKQILDRVNLFAVGADQQVQRPYIAATALVMQLADQGRGLGQLGYPGDQGGRLSQAAGDVSAGVARLLTLDHECCQVER